VCISSSFLAFQIKSLPSLAINEIAKMATLLLTTRRVVCLATHYIPPTLSLYPYPSRYFYLISIKYKAKDCGECVDCKR